MLVKEYGGEEPQASVGKSGEVGEWEIHPGYHVFRPIKLTDFNNYSTPLSHQEALSHQALHGELGSRPRGPSSIWKDSNLLSTLGLLWKTSHVDRRFIHWQNATSIFKNLFAPATENRNRHEFSDVAMRNEPLLCLDVAVTSDSPLRTGKMWQKTIWRSVAKPRLCFSSPAGEAHRPSYCQHRVSQRNSTLEILPLNPKVPHDTPATGKNNPSQPETDTRLPWRYFKGEKKVTP